MTEITVNRTSYPFTQGILVEFRAVSKICFVDWTKKIPIDPEWTAFHGIVRSQAVIASDNRAAYPSRERLQG